MKNENIQIIIEQETDENKPHIAFSLKIDNKQVLTEEICMLEEKTLSTIKIMLTGVFHFISHIDEIRKDQINNFINSVEEKE